MEKDQMIIVIVAVVAVVAIVALVISAGRGGAPVVTSTGSAASGGLCEYAGRCEGNGFLFSCSTVSPSGGDWERAYTQCIHV